jgi:hypothetical protein
MQNNEVSPSIQVEEGLRAAKRPIRAVDKDKGDQYQAIPGKTTNSKQSVPCVAQEKAHKAKRKAQDTPQGEARRKTKLQKAQTKRNRKSQKELRAKRQEKKQKKLEGVRKAKIGLQRKSRKKRRAQTKAQAKAQSKAKK